MLFLNSPFEEPAPPWQGGRGMFLGQMDQGSVRSRLAPICNRCHNFLNCISSSADSIEFQISKIYQMKLISPNKRSMNYFYISLIILLISGCGNSHNQRAKNENSDFQKAGWITDNREWPVADSLMYGDFPAPFSEKNSPLKNEIKSATLFITAAGYYSASINGKTLGHELS